MATSATVNGQECRSTLVNQPIPSNSDPGGLTVALLGLGFAFRFRLGLRLGFALRLTLSFRLRAIRTLRIDEAAFL